MSRELSTKLIKKGEGLRLRLYKCTAGKWTIGYGFNIEDNAIPLHIAEALLVYQLDQVYNTLKQHTWFTSLDSVRQAVIVDMCYNLGFTKLSNFKLMIAALKKKDYKEAAAQMKDSKWWTDVKDRAPPLYRMMLIGIQE